MEQIKTYLRRFLFADRKWGWVRTLVILLCLFLFTLLSHALFPDDSVNHLIQTWMDRHKAWKLVPRPVLQLLGLFALDYRFLWLALAAFISALFVGASYLKEIFRIPKVRYTLRYLRAGLTGWRYPNVAIDEGKLQVEPDTPNLARDIGGPGLVVVQPGNLVVFERLHKPASVRAEGAHFLSRFETIKRFPSDKVKSSWETPITDDQHGFVEKVTATTKDGITLQVEDINYRYRLRMGRAYGDFASRDPKHPNPFSVEAVRDMAYNRTVRIKDVNTGETELTPWHDMVNIAVEGAITEYIREHRFNEVVVPQANQAPRKEILNKLFSRAIRSRLRDNGAELVWSDIGHFKITDPRVADQLVEKWGAAWEGETRVRLAFGEAKRIELLEQSRAEAQADMLKHILDAFDQASLPGNTRENITNLLLARTAQILDAMKDRNQEGDTPQLPAR